MTQEVPVKTSLLDRLIDKDPGSKSEAPLTPSASLTLVKEGLVRDLEWLLNTPRRSSAIPTGCEELRESVYTYGFVDISSMMWSPEADERLSQAIESAIKAFEPRLEGVSVTPPPDSSGPTRQFLLKGILRLEPTPQHVAFATILDLKTLQFSVRGDPYA